MNCEPAFNRRLRQSPVVGIKVQCSDSAIVNGVTLSMCEQLQEDFQHCDRTWCFNEPTQKHLWQTRVEVRVEVGADQHQTDMCYLQHTIHLFTSILWVILVISSEMTGNTGQMSVCVSLNHCIHLSICVMSTFSKPQRLLRDGSETAPRLLWDCSETALRLLGRSWWNLVSSGDTTCGKHFFEFWLLHHAGPPRT